MNKKEQLMERYKTACDLKQIINKDSISNYVRQNYLALGLNPKALNMAKSLDEFYSHIKNENIWDSTWSSSLCIGAQEIKETDRDKVMSIYYPIFQAMEAGLWLFVYLEDCFLWLPMPKVKTVNGNRLHCTDGPAFELPDQKMYFLNGVIVDESIVMTPAEKLDPMLMLKETNAEIRREIVRKVGIERIIQKIGSEVIDRQGDYELLLLDLKDGRKREYLKMKNPSIGVWHVEGVPPGTKTVKEALTFRNGTDLAPKILT
jgi:hypothetical protein